MGSKKPRKNRGRLVARAVLALAALFFGLTVLPVLALRFIDPPTSAFMRARRAEAEEAGEKGFKLRYRWVPLEKVSPWYPRAVIASEDQNFGTHFGFDSGAIADALEDRLEGKSHRGASTITQQVAKNLFLSKSKSWLRKGLEAWFTVLLETLWSKRRILEVHVNIAELGNGIYGVGAASEVWFRKTPGELDANEGAALAAMLPSPRTRRPDAPSDPVAERARWILEQEEHLSPEVNALVPPRKAP